MVSERPTADGRRDIYFQAIKPDIPREQTQLRDEVERTLSSLQVLKGTIGELQFDAAFDKLLSLARLGLVGTKPNVSVALDALLSLKSELLDRYAGSIKNTYLRRFGLWSAVLAGLSVAAWLIIPQPTKIDAPFGRDADAFLLVWAGCMAGTWISVASRKLDLTFFDLARIEDDQLDPPIRLIFTGLLTGLLCLMLAGGILDVTIGTFRGGDWQTSPIDALLLGGLAGVGEKVLPANVLRNASRLFG